MNKIHSLAELNQYITQIKSNGGKIVSNYYLMANDVQQYIDSQKIYVINTKDTLQVILDEGNYYRLVFWANVDSDFKVPQLDKEVVCEILYYNTRPTHLLQAEPLLKRAGFREYAENTQIVFNLDEIDYLSLLGTRKDNIERSGYVWRVATQNDYTQILDLWNQYIDKYAFDLLMKNRCSRFSSEETIYVFESPEPKICAATIMLINGQICDQRHTVVDGACRGLGMGQAVVLTSLQEFKERGFKKCTGWIEKNNIKSIQLHLKFGSFTNKVCKQFVL